ncbi:hypothetical protein WA026_012811 [Henosepilachna vigintioctopunctata]|uniref:Uncharacterized protein n=1 Tax=Henosepilachna vigintioctopunctata TaxID=420089 RepID=A0AAW1TJZ4_9CUCU
MHQPCSEEDGYSTPKHLNNHLGGRGKLTEALIKNLLLYYGLAIRRNVNSVKDMNEAIMATCALQMMNQDTSTVVLLPIAGGSGAKLKL